MLLFFTVTLRVQYDQFCNIISQPECWYFYVLVIMRYNRNNQSSNCCQKDSLARLIFLFKTCLSRIMGKRSFISRIAKMVDSSNCGMLVQNTRWSWIVFWWFNFSKCQRWYPNMFLRLTFQVPIHLVIIARTASSALIFIYYSRQKQKQSSGGFQ